MIVLGTVLFLIVVFLVITLLILSRYGLFAPVKILEKNTGPYLLVYQKHIGDYKNVGPVMDKLYYDLKDNYSIETTRGFGLYYDNPREVDKNKLRSIVGCIVENTPLEELKKVKKKYGVQEYPSSISVVAEFPFRGKLSIILGIFRVYPKLNKYLEEKDYKATPIMELYDQPNGKIKYISSTHLSGEIFEGFLGAVR